MREIKFRAWDKMTSRMMTVDMLRIISNRGYQQIGLVTEGLDYLRTPENVELMQYTGLKDKNGKEIYEGDLLSNSEFIGQIVWDIGGFDWVKSNGVEYFIGNLKTTDIEVVGNIYENPDLLKP